MAKSHSSDAPRRRRRGASAETAARLLSPGQLILGVALLLGATAGLVLRTRTALTVLVGICVVFYALFAALKLVVATAGRKYRPPRTAPTSSTDSELPKYAILLPVHKEANILRHLVARIGRLDYPKQRLLALLLIEADDHETLEAARSVGLRFHGDPAHTSPEALAHITVVVIPPGGPKTKPNAMNVAMDLVIAQGCTYCTIYDAEDRPDPDQLLKAVGTFRLAPPRLACLQAELVFWNDDTNWLTALYWIGYKVHFRRFLPGLARLGLPIPLGGTSNHFRVDALLDIALPNGNVWDPHNLTEDADLGARLVSGGYRIELLGSVTLEEAPASSRIVDKQQRRWKGGYLQTGLVHTRHPLRTARRMGPLRWFCFNLMMLGTPFSLLINPIFLGTTCAFFITRSELIRELFPTWIYYPALVLLVVGNFSLLFELVQTCLEEAEPTRGRFGLVKHMLLAQFLWLWMSRSTYIAVFELFTGRRGWHKTPHGQEVPDDEFDLDAMTWPAPIPLAAPAQESALALASAPSFPAPPVEPATHESEISEPEISEPEISDPTAPWTPALTMEPAVSNSAPSSSAHVVGGARSYGPPVAGDVELVFPSLPALTSAAATDRADAGFDTAPDTEPEPGRQAAPVTDTAAASSGEPGAPAEPTSEAAPEAAPINLSEESPAPTAGSGQIQARAPGERLILVGPEDKW